MGGSRSGAGGRAVPVVSIVGRSGSGKTTLIERLIPRLTGRGLRVGTVKHDAHSFDIDRPGKDSWRHREAGAKVVVLSSARRVFVTLEVDATPALAALVEAHLAGQVDLVLTEGYRHAGAPMIEVHRSAVSSELLCDPAAPDLLAVASDRPWRLRVPVFRLDDVEAIAAFIVGQCFPPGTG